MPAAFVYLFFDILRWKQAETDIAEGSKRNISFTPNLCGCSKSIGVYKKKSNTKQHGFIIKKSCGVFIKLVITI